MRNKRIVIKTTHRKNKTKCDATVLYMPQESVQFFKELLGSIKNSAYDIKITEEV